MRSARSWSKSSTSAIADVRHMDKVAADSDITDIEVMSMGINYRGGSFEVFQLQITLLIIDIHCV